MTPRLILRLLGGASLIDVWLYPLTAPDLPRHDRSIAAAVRAVRALAWGLSTGAALSFARESSPDHDDARPLR